MLDWDETALRWINAHHYPLLDAVLIPVSYLGEAGAIWFAVCLALLVFGRREQKLTGLTLLLAMVLLDRLVAGPLGQVFHRERPYLALSGIRQVGIRWGGGSFPSGHAHSVWLATIILSHRWRRLTRPLAAFALLTCYSRPYLGMHYPLDVMVGAALGVAAGLGVVGLERPWRRRAEVQPQ